MKHKLEPRGIEWPEFRHGTETWILHACMCGCGKRRVEKIDGKWTAKQLGYEIAA